MRENAKSQLVSTLQETITSETINTIPSCKIFVSSALQSLVYFYEYEEETYYHKEGIKTFKKIWQKDM